MYCICCKKDNVKPIKAPFSDIKDIPEVEEDLLWKKEKVKNGTWRNINNEMIDGGIIHIVEAGYGSKHDGDQYILAICDDCINLNSKDGTILYYGNYMPGYDDIIKEDIENSKKAYRRRKNLDGLV